MKSKHWIVKNSKLLIDDRWLRVRADQCETPSGVPVDPYYVLEYADWVFLTVFDRENRVMVVRLYRHGNREVNLEIPGGVMDEADATPVHTAKRELMEETGYTADSFTGP
jgi:8-oxo-dGTP pyrophosphatase MutT (NUDIX family)